MMDFAIKFLLILLVIVLINRAILFFYFKETGFFDINRKILERKKIHQDRNRLERSGITPGGVSWLEDKSSDYSKQIELERVSRPIHYRKGWGKGRWKKWD